MSVSYANNGQDARYSCKRIAMDYGEEICQSVKGTTLDTRIGKLVLDALAPAALEASLAAASDLEAERAAADQHWRQRIERAAYEVERARRHYVAVDPDNRLVARTLEREWEQVLTEQGRLEADYERHRRQQPQALSRAERDRIRALADDLPAVWQAGTQEERQTILRLLLECVIVEVIDNSEQVRCQCH